MISVKVPESDGCPPPSGNKTESSNSISKVSFSSSITTFDFFPFDGITVGITLSHLIT